MIRVTPGLLASFFVAIALVASSTVLAQTSDVAHEERTWTDNTGTFRVTATFVRFRDGKVHLHRSDNDKVVAVDPNRLCPADKTYLVELEKRLTQPAPSPPQPPVKSSDESTAPSLEPPGNQLPQKSLDQATGDSAQAPANRKASDDELIDPNAVVPDFMDRTNPDSNEESPSLSNDFRPSSPPHNSELAGQPKSTPVETSIGDAAPDSSQFHPDPTDSRFQEVQQTPPDDESPVQARIGDMAGSTIPAQDINLQNDSAKPLEAFQPDLPQPEDRIPTVREQVESNTDSMEFDDGDHLDGQFQPAGEWQPTGSGSTAVASPEKDPVVDKTATGEVTGLDDLTKAEGLASSDGVANREASESRESLPVDPPMQPGQLAAQPAEEQGSFIPGDLSSDPAAAKGDVLDTIPPRFIPFTPVDKRSDIPADSEEVTMQPDSSGSSANEEMTAEPLPDLSLEPELVERGDGLSVGSISEDVGSAWMSMTDEQLIDRLHMDGAVTWKGIASLSHELEPQLPNFEFQISVVGQELLDLVSHVGFVQFDSVLDRQEREHKPLRLPPRAANPLKGWVSADSFRISPPDNPESSSIRIQIEFPRTNPKPVWMERVSGSLRLNLVSRYQLISISGVARKIGNLELPELADKGAGLVLSQPDASTLVAQVTGDTTSIRELWLDHDGETVQGSRLDAGRSTFFQFSFDSAVPADVVLKMRLIDRARELELPFEFTELIVPRQNP